MPLAVRGFFGGSLAVPVDAAEATCIFAALCYAEFASMVPVAGSAYTYAYATLGEIMGTMESVFGRHVEVPVI